MAQEATQDREQESAEFSLQTISAMGQALVEKVEEKRLGEVVTFRARSPAPRDELANGLIILLAKRFQRLPTRPIAVQSRRGDVRPTGGREIHALSFRGTCPLSIRG